MESSPSPIQDYLSYALAAAHRKVTASLNARLKNHGVQIEAWRILETLDAGDRMTMGQLAEVALMNPPTLSKLVDRMVADGLVHRQASQTDHRQINVLPTALGKKRMMQVRQEVETQDTALLNQLAPKDRQYLIEMLHGIG